MRDPGGGKESSEHSRNRRQGAGDEGQDKDWACQSPGDPREAPGVRVSQGVQGGPEGRVAKTDVTVTEGADVGTTQCGIPLSRPRMGHRLGQNPIF